MMGSSGNNNSIEVRTMLEDGDKGVIIQRDKTTYAVAPLKLTSAARIAIVGLREEDIDAVWADLGMEPGAGVGLCVRSVKACPGTTFCKRGMQDSLGVGMKLDETFHGMELPSKLKIGVSGCPNQCAETCIKDIGLVGMKNGWRLLVGGNGGGKPRLSQELVRDISEAEAFAAIDRIIAFYKANGARMQRLGALIEKMGFEEFKNAVG